MIGAVTVVALLASAVLGCRYVALGDSTGAGDGSYVSIVGKAVDAETTTNLHVPWEYLPVLVHNVEEDARYRDAIAAANMVTIAVGGNDALAALAWCEGDAACLDRQASAFIRNYRRLLGAIRELNPAAYVVVLDLYNPWGGAAGVDIVGRLQNLNEQLADAVCAFPPAAVARVGEAFNGGDGQRDPRQSGFLGADGLHPSTTGHQAIAAAVLAARCPARRLP